MHTLFVGTAEKKNIYPKTYAPAAHPLPSIARTRAPGIILACLKHDRNEKIKTYAGGI